MILLDTNILVRLAHEGSPLYKTTHAAISGCWRKGWQLLVSDQTLQEFWGVATKSIAGNGLGIEASRADLYIRHFTRAFNRLPERPGLFEAWRVLVNSHGVCGTHAYDVRQVAYMQTHGLARFMTYNISDFTSFPITLIDPRKPDTW